MNLTHLNTLESEAIHVIRETVAEGERPVLLLSGGKDSIVMLRLAEKAFFPAALPFPLLHVDTGHNFPEVIQFRDRLMNRHEVRIAHVQETIDSGRVAEVPGASRNRLQSFTLLDALRDNRFDVVFGGARRDEERARAKERIVSFRDSFGQWDPKAQRPEVWALYNTRIQRGEHVRVYPLSNWTELDVWLYIAREGLDLPSIYFRHEREVFERDGFLYATNPFLSLEPGEQPFRTPVRFRTVGDMTCTGAIRSDAKTIREVIGEIITSHVTERGASRADDKSSDAAMEERKREGYF